MKKYILFVGILIPAFLGFFLNVYATEGSDRQGEGSVGVERTCPGCVIGEVISSFTCAQEGYTIELIQPSNLPAGSDGRIIKTTTHNKEFYAHTNEVAPLGGFSSNPQMGYYISNLGYHDWDSPYCDRQGYPLKNTTVYKIEQAHGANYDGETNVLFDNNLDSYSREQLVTTFNQNTITPNISQIPVHCQACRGDVDPIDDNNGFTPGTYTTADGTEHDLWEIGNDDDGDDSPGRPPISIDGSNTASTPAETLLDLHTEFKKRGTLSDQERKDLIETRRKYLEMRHKFISGQRDGYLDRLLPSQKKTYHTVIEKVQKKITSNNDIDWLQDKIDAINLLLNIYDTKQGASAGVLNAVLFELKIILEEQLQSTYETEESGVLLEDIFNVVEEIQS